LSLGLGLLNEADEVEFTFLKTSDDAFFGMHGEFFILNHEVVEIVSEIVGASGSSVSIKHPKKAHLGPLNTRRQLFLFGLQDVQNNAHPVFIVFSDDALVGVSSVGLYVPALLLRGLGWLVILQVNLLWVLQRRVSKEQRLNVHKLDAWVMRRLLNIRLAVSLLTGALIRKMTALATPLANFTGSLSVSLRLN
jgi:hypothetical protein